jgi:hypothetical protein
VARASRDFAALNEVPRIAVAVGEDGDATVPCVARRADDDPPLGRLGLIGVLD